jgi:hypothetical protein
MIVAWRVVDLMRLLGVSPDLCVTGVKLSLDAQVVEFRIVPNGAVDRLLHNLMETGGSADGLSWKV